MIEKIQTWERRRPWPRPRWTAAVLGLVVLLPLAGCGGNQAPVTGKLTHKGVPVRGGTVFFSPVGADDTAGKPASAEVQADGTFALGTNQPGDGAVVGRHRVTYSPPVQELTEQQRTDTKYHAPPPPYMGLAPKQSEVEVVAGDNTIEVELVAAPKRRE
jgi:hypothetical protein